MIDYCFLMHCLAAKPIKNPIFIRRGTINRVSSVGIKGVQENNLIKYLFLNLCFLKLLKWIYSKIDKTIHLFYSPQKI